MQIKKFAIYYRSKNQWHYFDTSSKKAACEQFKKRFGLKVMPPGFLIREIKQQIVRQGINL